MCGHVESPKDRAGDENLITMYFFLKTFIRKDTSILIPSPLYRYLLELEFY